MTSYDWTPVLSIRLLVQDIFKALLDPKINAFALLEQRYLCARCMIVILLFQL